MVFCNFFWHPSDETAKIPFPLQREKLTISDFSFGHFPIFCPSASSLLIFRHFFSSSQRQSRQKRDLLNFRFRNPRAKNVIFPQKVSPAFSMKPQKFRNQFGKTVFVLDKILHKSKFLDHRRQLENQCLV